MVDERQQAEASGFEFQSPTHRVKVSDEVASQALSSTKQEAKWIVRAIGWVIFFVGTCFGVSLLWN
jgi:hypothetical protein